MNNQEKQKLNGKLARWAGFKYWKNWACKAITRPDGNSKRYPREQRDYVPHFTHSLNACFKWLVPKLYPSKLNKLELVALVNNAICDSIEQKIEVSLALCRAIEKLIDANGERYG